MAPSPPLNSAGQSVQNAATWQPGNNEPPRNHFSQSVTRESMLKLEPKQQFLSPWFPNRVNFTGQLKSFALGPATPKGAE